MSLQIPFAQAGTLGLEATNMVGRAYKERGEGANLEEQKQADNPAVVVELSESVFNAPSDVQGPDAVSLAEQPGSLDYNPVHSGLMNGGLNSRQAIDAYDLAAI